MDKRAEKQLAALPPEVQDRFRRVFEALSIDTRRPRPGCDIRKLHGVDDEWAVRVGSYRGVYGITGLEVQFTTFMSGHHAYR